MIDKVANRYVIVSLIGQGGMADVYKAHDIILNRMVAIKVLREKLADDPLVLVRFTREASAASKLSHPNLVDIYDVGESNGLHYIVMEYVKGSTLKQMISRRGALDVNEAMSIMKQLADGVAAAHDSQIIHRDIKPQNIMIKADGTVKITDFGIALASGSVALTHNNAVMGSAHYLAPESAKGAAPDVRVDIYSLGIVFYELLTNEVPFSGKTPAEIAFKHMQQPMPSVRKFNPAIPQSVENIITKATAKDPNERYSSIHQMKNDLDNALRPEKLHTRKLVLKTQTLDPGIDANSKKDWLTGLSFSKRKSKNSRRISRKTSWLACLGALALALCILLVVFYTGMIRIPGVLGYETFPEVLNLSMDEAIEKLEASHFQRDDIVIQESLSEVVPAGEVISSSIKAGEVVKKDSEIVLNISKGPSFLIPDYTGLQLIDVQQSLNEQGVILDIDTVVQGAANTNPGVILSQELLIPGTRIDPTANSKIRFVVAGYPSVYISEDFIGRNYLELKNELNQLGIAVIVKNISGSDTVTGVTPSIGTTYTQQGTDSVLTLYR